MKTIEEHAFAIDTPKFCHLLIKGDNVLVDQAKEIILRTDRFLTSITCIVSDERFACNYRAMSGLASLSKRSGFFSRHDTVSHDWDAEKALKAKLGVVSLNCVISDMASSCYALGPQGFCQPDGRIVFSDNIGKYPSVKDLYEDFVALAQAFPFLTLRASLFLNDVADSEQDFGVGFLVSKGEVRIVLDDMEMQAPNRDISLLMNKRLSGDFDGVHGLPLDWYDSYAQQVKSTLEAL